MVLEAKKQFYKQINDMLEVKESKKRKRKDMEEDEGDIGQTIQEFEHENEI